MDATNGGLPGQAVDLDLEGPVDVELEGRSGSRQASVVGKGKEEPAEDASPSKKPSGGEVLTVAMLRTLLAEQTEDLKRNCKQDIDEAVNQSEARMFEVVQGVKKDLSRQMQSTVGDMEKLKQDLAEAVKRVERLEELRSDISKQEGRSSLKGPMLVWGSWRPETRRRDIISDVSNVLKDVAVLDLLGGEIWVPASRHSVALSEFRLREGEDADGQADRIQKVITAVNFARVKSEYTAPKATIWCAVSQPRSERWKGSRCGKTRRLLHLGIGVAQVDCVYSTLPGRRG